MAPPSDQGQSLRVLVTGGSSGIGFAVAHELAVRGCRIALLARDRVGLEEAAGRLAASCQDLPTTLVADVADASATRAAIADAVASGGPFSHAVCSAGTFELRSFTETEPALLERSLRVNLAGVFHVFSALLPGMLEKGSGHLLAIGSVAAKRALPGNAAYSAAKYGLRGLLEVLAAEVKGSGVVVSMVHPGPVDTPLWDRLPANILGAFDRSTFLSPPVVGQSVADLLMDPPASFNDLDLFEPAE